MKPVIAMGKKIIISVKAVIISNGELLTIRKKDRYGEYYVLPGGKQKKYETITETLKRECIEEVNIEVMVGKILFLREYIGKNHEFAEDDYKKHKMEFFVECKIESGTILNGENPDSNQKEPHWIKLSELKNYNFYPKTLAEKLADISYSEKLIYLGDIN